MPAMFSLAHLTLLDLTPVELITVAARSGYQKVGIRLTAASPGGAAYPLMRDAPALRDTLARIRDTGVGVFDLEIIRIGAGFQAS